MNVKHFGCIAIHNKALYKCIIHSFIIHEGEQIDRILISGATFPVMFVKHKEVGKPILSLKQFTRVP